MKKIPHALLILCAAAFVAASGCSNAPQPTVTTDTANTANTNAPVASASPSASATPGATPAAAPGDVAGLPVTLPVLDAMFADESFAGELKSKLQLSDEQVARLRAVAREETGGLNEGKGESGSTAGATKRAAEKIKGVIGEEKTQALTALVRERWEGGEGAGLALSAQPNSVPTDTRIVVNAPAYRMDVFENGQLVKTYRVGIGYPEFPLPQGMRKAATIIFNPTWTPPDEPWVEASNKVKAGQKVEAGSKLNPLGPIKIPIGQPSLIHGGKSPAKLGTFASHGCVGLTSPQVQDFAVVLAKVAGAQLTPEQVKAYASKPTETKSVKLDNAVPVELRYETIVVEDGLLHVYRDVYDKGTNTEENLRKVLDVYGVKPEDLSQQERAQVSDALKAMARDAQGNPTDGQPAPTPTPGKSKQSDDKKSGARVTRTIKGQKEIVIEIAALKGKGYPAPVNLSPAGSQPTQQAAAAPKKQPGK
jgi:lipoprotein-anchoring transpeptidase ErfK/SrfK